MVSNNAYFRDDVTVKCISYETAIHLRLWHLRFCYLVLIKTNLYNNDEIVYLYT